MSFQDSAVIFFIALLLFGPKKLPELARQLGKLMGEFRRASNDFRMQMEDELRIHEQAERQKQIAAIQTAAPSTAATLAADTTVASAEPLEPHPHEALSAPAPLLTLDPAGLPSLPPEPFPEIQIPDHTIAPPVEPPPPPDRSRDAAAAVAPLPIATSGSLSMMPPATGLPVGRSAPSVADAFALVPQAPPPSTPAANPHTSTADPAGQETATHG